MVFAVPTVAPTILLANRNRPVIPTNWPVGYVTGLQLIIRNIALLVNGLPHWQMGNLVKQQAGL